MHGVLHRPGLFREIEVAKSGKYLGVQVVVDATPGQWAEVATKVAQRAIDVRTTSQGLGARVRWYSSHLHAPARRAVCEADWLIVRRMRHAAPGLWMSLPPVAMQRAKTWCLDVKLRDHHADNPAAEVRVATQNSEFQRLLEEIEAARNSDEVTLSPWRPWHDATPAVHLGQVRRWYLGVGRDVQQEAPAHTRRQSHLRLCEEERRRCTPLEEVLTRRVRRWSPDNPEALVGAWMHWSQPGPLPDLV